MKSPLRYPGGKAKLATAIVSFFPKDIVNYWEPFCGGCSVGFNTSAQTYLFSDVDKNLINFFNTIKSGNFPLARLLDTSKESFVRSKELLTETPEGAALYFFINRASFSGLTLSGGYSKDAAEFRYTQSSINRVLELDLSKCTFKVQDFFEAKEDEVDFIYADPPYHIESETLYGERGNNHRGFNHHRLAKHLYGLNKRFVLSYNDSPEIRKLYQSWAEILEIEVNYSINSLAKPSKELVIRKL